MIGSLLFELKFRQMWKSHFEKNSPMPFLLIIHDVPLLLCPEDMQRLTGSRWTQVISIANVLISNMMMCLNLITSGSNHYRHGWLCSTLYLFRCSRLSSCKALSVMIMNLNPSLIENNVGEKITMSRKRLCGRPPQRSENE